MQNDTSDLKVQTPCRLRWADLEGNGERRWCGQCSLHVVDAAALTRAEARRLVTGSDGRVCMRLVQSSDGRVLHAGDPSPQARRGAPTRRGAMAALRAALAAAAGMLAACWDATSPPDEGGRGASGQAPPDGGVPLDPAAGEERPVEIMGDVCYPAEE
ncbi:MAG: hypothetical protein AAGB93_12720 [Planctomycetota bacterium]